MNRRRSVSFIGGEQRAPYNKHMIQLFPDHFQTHYKILLFYSIVIQLQIMYRNCKLFLVDYVCYDIRPILNCRTARKIKALSFLNKIQNKSYLTVNQLTKVRSVHFVKVKIHTIEFWRAHLIILNPFHTRVSQLSGWRQHLYVVCCMPFW